MINYDESPRLVLTQLGLLRQDNLPISVIPHRQTKRGSQLYHQRVPLSMYLEQRRPDYKL
jgi:hypothetical protein